jgi:cytochrome d ubiquinol oxidase subunit II
MFVGAWGVAQYPYLLPFGLTIDAGAGSATTAKWVLVWFVVALATAVPALVLLYVLDQRGELVDGEIVDEDELVLDLTNETHPAPAHSS